MAQEAISYLIAEKAREGKLVARLKWGDPFVFDRGGEEALFLHEQAIPFEVVPGVPLGIGVPGLRRRAGDLPRRRRHDHAGARIRGREPHAARHRLGEPGTARRHRSSATPGRSSCRASSTRCIANGWPERRTRRCRLQRHAPQPGDDHRHDRGAARAGARASPRRGPAILVVGRVVGFRDHLRWFDARPLFGKRGAGHAAARSGGRDGRSAAGSAPKRSKRR